MAAKNLRIIGTSVGPFSAGDIVPAYALASANPEFLIEARIVEPTNEMATVEVSADDLVKSSPESSSDLVKAHAAALETIKRHDESIEQLHEKCLDLESKNEALTKELGAKTAELSEAKKARDQHAVDLETAKNTIGRLKQETADLNTLLQEVDKPATPTTGK